MIDVEHGPQSAVILPHLSTVILPFDRPTPFRYFYRMDLAGVVKRIDERLEAVHLSASAASERAGLSRDAIRNMKRALKGRPTAGVSTLTLAALAPVLRTSPTYLLEGTGPAEGEYAAASPEVTDVPLVSWVSAGELADQEAVVDFGDFPTISAIDLPDGDWIALRVDGPSMNKISPPDSIVLANRRDKRLVANACYIIADETGRATYKRYRPGAEPPFQPASYEDIAPPLLEGAITVVGRVRRSIIDL